MHILQGAYWKAPASIVIGIITFSEAEWRLILTLIIWMIFDTITGILAARKEKQPICSSKMFNLAVKTLIYFGGTVGVKALTITYPVLNGFLVQSFLGWFIVTEVKSFIENANRLGVGINKELFQKLFDMFKKS